MCQNNSEKPHDNDGLQLEMVGLLLSKLQRIGRKAHWILALQTAGSLIEDAA